MDDGLSVLVGLSLDATRLTEIDDLPVGEARIGDLVVGPRGLLSDLELRLGLAAVETPHSVRIAHWSTKIALLAVGQRFYSQSYAIDAWGTTAELLRWRDALVEAGWRGDVVPNGGERLRQLSELEALCQSDPSVPAGIGDRLQTICDALERGRSPKYSTVKIVESQNLWPLKWRRVFDGLSNHGCTIETLAPLPIHPDTNSDLGRIQQHLIVGGEFAKVVGDGSFVLMRGETVWETAQAAAAILSQANPDDTVVIRNGSTLPLDLALEQHGLATQGLRRSSHLRPVLQALPLALELVFEPKDPNRVLELIALPQGPFRGLASRFLAEALAEKPGLENDAWDTAYEKITERILAAKLAEQIEADQAKLEATEATAKIRQRVHEWIEQPGFPQEGAPRTALLSAVSRVQTWLQNRIVGDGMGQEEERHVLPLLRTAYGQASAITKTIAADPRESLSLLQVRQLVEAVLGAGGAIDLCVEQAGRIAHVTDAASFLVRRPTVLWWGCVSNAAEAPASLPFIPTELKALSAAGVDLVTPRSLMTAIAARWRAAILSATDRCILVAPRVEHAASVSVHPIWDELTARVGGDREVVARISVDASEILQGTAKLPGLSAKTARLDESKLPASRHEWTAPAKLLAQSRRASASSLETLLGCPLRWVLERQAAISRGTLVSLPDAHILYGRLGHRLIELLHQRDAFKLRGEILRTQAKETINALLPKEAATLLLPGLRVELDQVRQQLLTAVVNLAETLASSKLEIIEVECTEEMQWQGQPLVGRLDVLLRDARAHDVILDLKWGRTRYKDMLKSNAAVQLAIYARLRQSRTNAKTFPEVAYYSLSRAVVLATSDETFAGASVTRGADATNTWNRIESTVKLIQAQLDRGRVPVTGVMNAPSLLHACDGEPDPVSQLVLAADAACTYCELDAVCGRRWEKYQ